MTTLTQLIEYHCPNGVEYVKLGDVAEIARKTCQPARMGTGSVVLYSLPAFDEGVPERVDPTEIKSGKIILSEPSLLVPKLNPRKPRVWLVKAPSPRSYCSTEFFPIQADNSSLSLSYLYYVICDTISELAFLVDGGSNSHKRLNRDIYLDLLIPLPAREVQDAIVERLDAFAGLIESLDSEIALREKHFEYFREQLLSFDELDGVEHVKLGDVATVRSGWGFPTKYQGGSSGVPFFKVADMNHVDNQTHLQRSMNYVERSVLKSMKAGTAPAGTVVFPKIGAAVATNKKRLLVEESSYDNNVAGVIPGEGLNPLFLFYFFLGFDLCTIALQSGATPSIRKSAIEGISLPLPPREVQQNIVDKLDTMQALIDNLRQERDLRRTQFEYYREKLLTFNS